VANAPAVGLLLVVVVGLREGEGRSGASEEELL